MTNDPLSDLLQLTDAKSVISGGIAAGGPWAIHFPPPGEIKFAVIARGACWLKLDGQKTAIRCEQGDVGLMPGNHGYTVGSGLEVPARDGARFFAGKRTPIAKIGDGSECLILAGGVTLHPSCADLLKSILPPVIHVRAAAPQAPAVRWVVEQLAAEEGSCSPGTRIASTQLAQLLLIQILRAHLSGPKELPPGWLRAIRDERIAPALKLIHAQPGKSWKLSDLAKASAMSRTSFAVHFKSVAGVAPLTYLTEWRMRLAQRDLREEDASVSEIASTFGYTSESAFSHAFKRVTGSRPSDYRTQERTSA